ncbi:MAG: adenine deaminase [Lachnospiraceae bacterium]|jgi:adenine deaminase|nr:adenine deaminase [Lachnospiraceae bacterium]
MRTLLKNGTVINVFTGEEEQAQVLMEDDRIVGVGDYNEQDADETQDVSGRYICPGFIDGHIHIESTMLTPGEFARVALPHGTTSVMADPHEIANVCGAAGIRYMLEASEGIPMTVYIMLPSCVPATGFDESGAVLTAEDLEPFYSHPRVLGLAEVMDYPGVIARDREIMKKIRAAIRHGRTVNGHAPLLSGRELDCYIAAGIGDDHECSSVQEAKERIRKGQRVMIRQGTAAPNLRDLLPLLEEPWAHRCLLVSDDKHAADLLNNGHIDAAIRMAAQDGRNPITAIRMATLWAAECFGLRGVGAIAPGYTADILVLDDLHQVKIRHVYQKGRMIVENGRMHPWNSPAVCPDLERNVRSSFHINMLSERDFYTEQSGMQKCHVIRLVKNQLITEDWITDIDFDKKDGMDLNRDILKIAVAERHKNTGHKCIGFISGTGMKRGAAASSIAHDSHNLIIIGTNEADMAAAGNRVREMGGGCAATADGNILAELPLPVSGLMSDASAPAVAEQNQKLWESERLLGVPGDVELFMLMAFTSLPVIPHLKITTQGLVDVDRQRIVPLCE